MTDWLQTGSRTAGLDWVNGLYRQNAQRQAGEALTRGDYGAAANTLAQNGDLEGFGQVQAYGQQQQDRAAAQDKETTARQLQFTISTAQALEEVAAQGGDVLAAYNGLRPALVQMGTAPEEIDRLGQLIGSNPAVLGQIRQLAGRQLRELQIVNAGNGNIVAVDQNTGEVVNSYQAPRAPTRVAVGQDYIEVGPDGTVTPLYQGAREPEYRVVQNTDGSSDIVAVGGREGGIVAPAADVPSVIQSIIPGARFTSGLREPEQNRRAGGVPNSNHLTGQAIDIAPPDGISRGQFRQQLAAQGVEVSELIDEGDHWHVAWRNDYRAPNIGQGESVGGARVVAQGQNRGPAVRQLSPQEVNELGLPEGTVAQRRADGSINVVSRGGSERYTEGQRNAAYFAYRLNGARDTLARLEQRGIVRPTPAIIAFGEGRVLENALGEEDRLWLQAARNWLAPILRKDTGAAITAPEVVYYMGEYLPSPTDSPAVIAQKAAARRRAEEALRGLAGGAYEELFPGSGGGRPQGQRNVRFQQTPQQIETRRRIVPDGQPSGARPGTSQNPYIINPQSPAASYNNIPSGGLYIDPQGRIRRKP